MTMKYLAYRLAQRLSCGLPPRTAYRLAEQLADLQWRWSQIDRAAVHANLSVVLRGHDTLLPSLVRETFRNFGRYLIEFFTAHIPQRFEITVQGGDALDRAADARRGVIIWTGHLGNWELGAMTLQRLGWRVAAIALPHDDSRMNRLFDRQRQRCGVEVISLGPHATRHSLMHLEQGGLLGILGDRDFTGRTVDIRCWGRRLAVPAGPALLSLRRQTPVVPVFLIREGQQRLRLQIEPPIWPTPLAGRTIATAVQELTQQLVSVLERYVTRFPDQWLVFRPLFQSA